MNATAITLPFTVINWLLFNPAPCSATKSSSDLTKPSFINVTKVEFETITDEYCDGFAVSAATIISL